MIGLVIGLFAACYFDYSQKRIPNRLILLLLVYGCIYAWQSIGWSGLPEYLVVAVLVIFAFYPFFRLGMIGAGDVKLLGVCAPFFPSDKILFFLFITMAVSAVISIFHMLYFKNFKERVNYFLQYISDCTLRNGWKPYFAEAEKKEGAAICMAGPVLMSVLLYLGGIY